MPEGKGVALCWDNVVYDSPLLGYVNAGHQVTQMHPKATVLTYYWPLSHKAPADASREALARPLAEWQSIFLAELLKVHPELDGHVERVDIWLWGHAMVRPTRGFIWGERRRAMLRQAPPVFTAHSDMSGNSLFEEAYTHGVRAAENVLAHLGMPFQERPMTLCGQPWIFSPRFDLAFILAPAILVTIAAVAFHGELSDAATVSPLVWLVLIVGVDVSHVYSTLFRTYLDKQEFAARPLLYIMTPIVAWLAGCLLYSAGSLVFWRVLAYAAVFHFVRQQYGFMMIYGRRERDLAPWCRRLDKAAIYGATLYPLIYWHCHAREFDWFVRGDFLSIGLPLLGTAAGIAYAMVLAAYGAKESLLLRRGHGFNLPRNLLLAGTALSWFAGIVLFDNDLVFTATNVVAHGVPYMALIWGYGRNQAALQGPRSTFLSPWIARAFTWKAVPLFIGALFLLAVLEEGLWDGLVWREHGRLFWPAFSSLPGIRSPTLAWLVPLLAVPQATHYILDAFIWRMHVTGTNWREILFLQSSGKVAAE